MRHQWFTTTGPHDWFMRSRQCSNCGAKQKLDVIHYDRINGTMRAWRPLVGRCQAKGSKNPRYKKGAPIFAKINGGWFKSSVVEDFGDVVRVTVAGDCDREVSKSDVSIR